MIPRLRRDYPMLFGARPELGSALRPPVEGDPNEDDEAKLARIRKLLEQEQAAGQR
jgi:hypothetical protein